MCQKFQIFHAWGNYLSKKVWRICILFSSINIALHALGNVKLRKITMTFIEMHLLCFDNRIWYIYKLVEVSFEKSFLLHLRKLKVPPENKRPIEIIFPSPQTSSNTIKINLKLKLSIRQIFPRKTCYD